MADQCGTGCRPAADERTRRRASTGIRWTCPHGRSWILDAVELGPDAGMATWWPVPQTRAETMSWRLRELLDWVDEDPTRAVDLRPELQRIAAAIDRLPSRPAETTAGAPENLRALDRMLLPYARCTGHRENCGPNCLGGGLCQVLAMAYVNVGAELERLEKIDG